MTLDPSPRRSKLLFVSPVFPLPLDRGQHVRVYNLLLACAERFEVTFVCPTPDHLPEGDRFDALVQMGTTFRFSSPAEGGASIAGAVRASWAARGMVPPRRLAALAPYRAVIDGLDLSSFALCFVERGHLTPLASGLYERTIVDLDDLEHVRLWREMTLHGGPLRQAKSLPRLVRLIFRETLGLHRFRAALVCSESDRRQLARLGAPNVHVVPNGASATPPMSPAVVTQGAVFVGNCHYPPNRDAIELLRSVIVPDLRSTHPDFAVDIIGPYSDEPGIGSEGINGRGFVDDLPAELRRHKVFVAPLQLGGGTKLKILDAMAAGIAVVTTSVGAEGLNLEHGRHAMIADDPATFAQHVRTVLADADLRTALAENAERHVGTSLSWDRIRADFSLMLEALSAAAPLNAKTGS